MATQRAAVALGRHQVVWHLAWALHNFHVHRGYLRDALDSWQTALDATPYLSDSAVTCVTHRCLGRVCSRLGRHEEAVMHLEWALGLAVHHRDRGEQAHTQQTLANAWGRQDPGNEASILDSLGYIAHHTGDHGLAIDLFGQALAGYRALGHNYFVAFTLDNLGHPHAALGHRDRARAIWAEALVFFREQGRDNDVARVQRQLDDLGGTA
ncbi:tetratricopeptide repeat protein [Actinokineospora globicatena]|uniref:Tetratricopeptide repeat-containing protein n=1 Tax=Actinokineospora globicatena TaxID=103729 RepID=A0A9W6V788_9PSEU|nr:tetratricopeptide repeat protein [Actinokineospora globicatena]GLW89734.1 hypothetical protein Aglo03_05500 [Actinokineospora globicatena]